MNHLQCLGLAFLTLALSLPAPAAPENPAFEDPLDHPAASRSAVASRPMMAVAAAGQTLVAVGMRGMVVLSRDAGKSWSQSASPVQSDLLAVHFPEPQQGWAVGHDGVILHSEDGGKTWQKQFDGRMAGSQFKKYYEELAGLSDSARTGLLGVVESDYGSGPTLPFLDVWFEDAQHGFVVGSYGLIAGTVDGGKTWQPWMDRIDNEQSLNLNSIRGIGGNVYIAGEQGLVYKLNRTAGRFEKVATGYAGSFFGIAGGVEGVIAFGLRGAAYRSVDGGKTWTAVTCATQATLTGGSYGAARKQVFLVTDTGQVVSAAADTGPLELLPIQGGLLTGDITQGTDSLVLVGLDGIHTHSITPAALASTH